MNNVPPFPPAERFGTAMLALIHALAARYGWLMPKWLIKRMEDEVRGLVEAFSLLAAEGAKLLAAAAAAETAAEIPSSATEPGPTAWPAIRKSPRTGGHGGAARPAAPRAPETGTSRLTPAPRRARHCRPAIRIAPPARHPHSRSPHSRSPPARASLPPISRVAIFDLAKPTRWYAYFVSISKR